MTTAPEPSVESYLPAINSLLTQIISRGGFNLKFTIRKGGPAGADPEDAEMVVEFDGADADLLLEKNGALLDALEYVVLKAVCAEESAFRKFTFDCKDWRRIRAKELHLTARMAAQQVIESGSPFSLSPMNSRERRIVHLALKGESAVRTMSEGAGALRKVVVLPASGPSSR